MKNIVISAVLLTFGLVAAGCGDDGGSAGPFPGQQPEANTPDVPDVSDLLDDLSDGELDDADLEDLMESAQDMAESFGDSGADTVTVDGQTIEFTSEICFAGQGDFTIEGPGAAADGTPVWISISHTVDSREEMAEFLDESLLEMMYGDADPIIESSFSAVFGRTELFGDSPEGMPSYNATAGAGGVNDMAVSIDGSSASGSGTATDYSFSNGDPSARFDFTFQAACG